MFRYMENNRVIDISNISLNAICISIIPEIENDRVIMVSQYLSTIFKCFSIIIATILLHHVTCVE